MIDEHHPVFKTRPCLSGYGYEFLYSLTAAIERHLATSQRSFNVDALRKEFISECGVNATRQAYNSALSTLMRQKKIERTGRGIYQHTKWS